MTIASKQTGPKRAGKLRVYIDDLTPHVSMSGKELRNLGASEVIYVGESCIRAPSREERAEIRRKLQPGNHHDWDGFQIYAT